MTNLISPHATYVDLLAYRAQAAPRQIAFHYLADGESEEVNLTYEDLDRGARTVAALLQSQVSAGERVLLLYPPGPDYIVAFLGCLYAGVIAVPAYPPRLNRSLDRLRMIVADSQATVALTNTLIYTLAQRRLGNVPDLAALHWLTTDNIPLEEVNTWLKPDLNSDTLAFLQYTSGSTASPKGVMLTHQNLLHNSSLLQHFLGASKEDVAVIWVPPYHDMGLIGGILTTLFVGGSSILMSPLDFLQRPLRWLQAISRYRAKVSTGPNFAYDLCVRKSTPEERAALDLSCWEVALNGAEPVRPETLDRFAEAFAPSGFRREAFAPCYGLAEATLIVSGNDKSSPPVTAAFDQQALQQNQAIAAGAAGEQAQRLAGCGRILPDMRVAIVDPETRLACAPDQIGEIWISGPSVAQGYWNRPQATEETFQAFRADQGGGPYLRTGDLGFVREGELFVTARLKDLIIIRGRNHYPQDIELTVAECHPAMRPGGGAAFSVDVGGQERLVVVQEVARIALRTLDTDEVAEAVRRAVAAQHELLLHALVLVKPGSIAKTSSGKIQRHASRHAYLNGTLNDVGHWVEPAPTWDTDSWPDEAPLSMAEITQKLMGPSSGEGKALLATYLQEMIARLTGRATYQEIGLNQTIDTLGLDSLKALELKNQVEVDLDLIIPMSDFLAGPTIDQLADTLSELLVASLSSTERTDSGQQDGQDEQSVSAEEAENLLANLDQLSEAEVDALLASFSVQEGNSA